MLGGRSEVIDAPAIELFKYMDMKIEKDELEHKQKQAEMYINYLSNIFSQPLDEKPSQQYLRAKKEFESMLIPSKDGSVKKKAPKKYEWDFEVEEREIAEKLLESK